ncbi:O-methyltransferase [Gillisia sp. M10.2A]|uniref:O-methyltransferase n=1 Tax=Gillisia lutea TaxID=2909668 RepID=A0ABS9EJ94_9FLAO|nr:O-methyltransferase [Gillisia lutea]MCF4102412.1 O-methyltransferase [Gillisia lutea]
MHFIPEALDHYSVKHTQEEPELLKKLTRETYQKVLQPRMLSGHYQGRLLSIISKLIKPKSILELGTYTGYSALCLAEGLQKDGVLHTIDINEELYDFQRKYFDLSPYKNQIHQHLGNALEIVPSLEGKFDIIFVDADKPNYPAYFNMLVEKLNPGGVILTDNVLWSGKVVENVKKDDISTQALLRYNKMVAEDPRLESILLPIRDGLSLSRLKDARP